MIDIVKQKKQSSIEAEIDINVYLRLSEQKQTILRRNLNRNDIIEQKLRQLHIPGHDENKSMK
jgi:hypothetical protein